jgi:hypothetical protein
VLAMSSHLTRSRPVLEEAEDLPKRKRARLNSDEPTAGLGLLCRPDDSVYYP